MALAGNLTIHYVTSTHSLPRFQMTYQVLRPAIMIVAFWNLAGFAPLVAQEPPRYENLHVLPADISRDDLLDAMLDNLRGLSGGRGLRLYWRSENWM